MANPDDLARAKAGDKELPCTNLSGADLIIANLAGANLEKARLKGAAMPRGWESVVKARP